MTPLWLTPTLLPYHRTYLWLKLLRGAAVNATPNGAWLLLVWVAPHSMKTSSLAYRLTSTVHFQLRN